MRMTRSTIQQLCLAAGLVVATSMSATHALAQDGWTATPDNAAAPPPPPSQPVQNDPPADVGEAGIRLAIQGRFVLVSALDAAITGGNRPVTPVATVGVRLMDQRLFLGLGLGFGGTSVSTCGNAGCDNDKTTRSQSYFSVSPVATFDVLRERFGALYLAGWFNFLSYSAVHLEHTGDASVETGGGSGIGLNLAVGLRGKITDGLSIGTEWGWGFVSASDEGNASGDPDDTNTFAHGIFGSVVVEGSIGL